MFKLYYLEGLLTPTLIGSFRTKKDVADECRRRGFARAKIFVKSPEGVWV